MLIAKMALQHKGRIIPVGAEVPADYKRLREMKRRGWIVESSGPAASTPRSKSPPKAVKAKEPIIEAPAIDELEPETEPQGDSTLIENLDYSPIAVQSLSEVGVISILDIEGWDIDRLKELKGIGQATAVRLIADYEAAAALDGIITEEDGPELEDDDDEEVDESEVSSEEGYPD